MSAAMERPNKRCPVFLRNTYHMVNTHPTAIGWTDDGKNFVIKNPSVLASEIIPKYFKHNNVQSFIRQLQFYGFRKIKNKCLPPGSSTKQGPRQLFFRHEKFVRGRPDLLVEIKKPSSQKKLQDKLDKEDVDSLKSDVGNITSIVTTLKNDVDRINSLLEAFDSQKAIKKRRIETNVATPIFESSTTPLTEKDVSGSMNSVKAPVSCERPDIKGPQKNCKDATNMCSIDIFSQNPSEMEDTESDNQSVSTELLPNDDILDLFFEVVNDDKLVMNERDAAPATPVVPSKPVTSSIDDQIAAIIGAGYVHKLYHSIHLLPTKIKHMYTPELLLSNITDPDSLKEQINDIFKLASEINKIISTNQ